MKKFWLAMLAVPVVAYPAAAWYLGAQVESTLDAQYAQMETLPYAKIVERSYERGVFGATESVTIELFGQMFRALQQPTAATQDEIALTPVRMRLNSNIQHGPFAGGAPAAAVIDSELVLDGATRVEVAKLFGDKNPLTGRTVFNLDGSGTAQVLSPAFRSQFTHPETGEAFSVAWKGVTADVAFAPNMAHYTMRGAAPELEIKSDATHMRMTGMRFDGEQQRLFADDPLLFSGKVSMTLDEIQMSGAGKSAARVAFKQISYDVDIPVDGDFIDMDARMGAQVVDIDGTNYGPAHYDLSLKHLHARTVAKLYRVMLQAYSDPAMMRAGAAAGLALAPLAQPAMELLAYNPTFHLERLSFTTPDGEARVDLRAGAPGITADAVTNPGLIMAVLDAGANIALPEPLLLDIGKAGASAQIAARSRTGEVSAENMQMIEAQLEGKLQQLTGQGFVTRDGGVVKTTLVFKAGQLTVNGQPFNPMAMQ